MLKKGKKLTSVILTAAMVMPSVISGVNPLNVRAAQTEGQEIAVQELTDNNTPAPEAWGAVPNENQYAYQKEELAAFCHFGMNTFTNKEWGDGQESPSSFDLTDPFDADTYVSSLKKAGFKKLIVTAKHHDGFCIWRSAYTEHDLESTNYPGDVLQEISAACTKYDMDMGLYLSPWDVNAPSYGYRDENGNPTDKENDVLDYNEYYKNQLTEILGDKKYGNNGVFKEVWMDGAKGSGAMAQEYDLTGFWNTIHTLQPSAMLFGGEPYGQVRWIGNESGYSYDETWAKSKTRPQGEGKLDKVDHNNYRGFGDGDIWTVPEADVSITSGWFWGPNKNTPHSLEKLADIYFRSVGLNAPLLLNVAPNRYGTVDQQILDRIAEFGENIDVTFKDNLAQKEGVTVTASATRGNDTAFAPAKVVDGDDQTYWTMDDDATTGNLVVDLGEVKTFDVVSIEEAIQLGQRIKSFTVEYQDENGTWKKFGEGKTIGSKRLCRSTPVKASKVRINITGSYAVPLISEVGIFKASKGFEIGSSIPEGLENIDITDRDVSDGKGFTFGSSGWNNETGNQFLNGTNIYSSQKNAEVTMKFKGTKAWVMGTTDPNHGEADIYIDGAATPETTINTNAASRSLGQKIYTTPDLTDGEHTIKIVAKTNKAIGIEALVALNNEGKGALEFEENAYTVPEDTENTFTIKRVGGSNGEITVKFQDQPGTAVQSEYEPKSEFITFADGETTKTVTIQTKRQTKNTGDLYFYISLADPTGAIVGFNGSPRVTIIDSDKITKEKLVELIEAAEAYREGDYTAETWAVYAEALARAKALVANEHASLTAIVNAYQELEDAIQGLIAPVTGMVVTPEQATLKAAGDTVQLVPTVLPEHATNKTVTYVSSNTKVAAVDQNGLVTAVGNGEAEILVTTQEGNFQKKVNIKVEILAAGVKLDKNSYLFTAKEQKLQLNAAVNPENAMNQELIWTTSDAKVATVNASGMVTAVGNGKADITVTTKDGGFKAVCKVEVRISSSQGTRPEKVAGVKASKNATKSIKVSWKAAGKAESYNVYIKPKGGKWKLAANTAKTSVTVKKLAAGTKYDIKVGAVNKAGEGTNSKTIVTATKPEKVKLISVKKNKAASAKLKYSKTKASGYQLYKKEGKGKYKYTATLSKTTAKVTKLKRGKTYRFKVRSFVKVGNKTYYGAYSNSLEYKVK